MRELEFFIDVSPNWWLKARVNEIFLRQYVFEKFDYDFYPRIISEGREKIDLDKTGQTIKTQILKVIQSGNFEYEFLPEDEILKESYSISNGYINFHPRKKKINARLLIKVKI